jgi:hypothetical protein
MLEILLTGVVLVLNYFIAHHVVLRVERQRGTPLGALRTLVFFAVFLLLTLLAFQLLPLLFDGGTAGIAGG